MDLALSDEESVGSEAEAEAAEGESAAGSLEFAAAASRMQIADSVSPADIQPWLLPLRDAQHTRFCIRAGLSDGPDSQAVAGLYTLLLSNTAVASERVKLLNVLAFDSAFIKAMWR